MGNKAEVQSCSQKCKTGIIDVFKKLDTCLCQPTEEEAQKTRGQMLVRARKFDSGELKEDTETMKALEELIGAGAVDLAKITRHKDRWLLFSSMFGIKPSWADIEDIEQHLASMAKVETKIDVFESDDVRDIKNSIKLQFEKVRDAM